MNFVQKFILSLIIFLLPGSLFSQSRFLEEGVAGTGFIINTEIDYSIAESTTSFASIGASTAYSIGGIMDIGFVINRETGIINGIESINWNLDLLYNLIAIKQNEVNPINVQLEVAYGYTNYNSEYLDIHDYTKTSQGYELGISLFHEFLQEQIFSFILGGEVKYSNFNHITYESGDPLTAVVESYVHEENLYYGGFAFLSFKPDSGPLLSVGAAAMFNFNENLMEMTPSVIFILPSY